MSDIPAPSYPGLDEIWRSLRAPALVLLAGLVLLGLAYGGDAAAAWRVWVDSTAYSHCFFVLPIAIYLAWDRRGELLAAPVVPLPWLAALVAPMVFAWLVAERLGIAEGRQLMAVSVIEALFLAVLGWRMCLAMSAPLLYLYFLVPFGAFLTPILQDWTTVFVAVGLNVLDIPHFIDGYMIEIPEGRFYIAEACAGLRFLIASIAFGVLYACVMYRGWWRRAAFIFASVAVPIVANWLRALGIVALGHVIGSAEAAAADHIIYGWIFFSVVTLVLIVAGLPFRQDGITAAPPRSTAPVPPMRRLVPAAAAVVGVALFGAAVSAWFDFAARAPMPAPAFAWTVPPGCRASPPIAGAEPGSETVRFTCPQGVLNATAQVFSPRATWTGIGLARLRLTAQELAEDSSGGSMDVPGSPLPQWSTVLSNELAGGAQYTATGLWVDGRPARGGLSDRMLLARHSMLGGGRPSVLLAANMRSPRESIGPEEERQMQQFISGFLRLQTRLGSELARLGG
jgi:exosortase A